MTSDSHNLTSVGPHQPSRHAPTHGNLRDSFERGFRLVYPFEPLWIAASTVLVYVSYLFHLHPALPWIGLAMALLPFPISRLAGIQRSLTTSFDPAIALLMLGGLVGLISSPQFGLSLGAFQSMIALSACYYSCVNYLRLDIFMKGVFPVALLTLLTVFIVIWVRPDEPVAPDTMPCTFHGLALSLLIAATILAGMTIFGRSPSKRLITGLLSICLIIAIIVMVDESVPRLLSLDSVTGRIPRWRETIHLLRDSPFTGLGLGCWAFAFHGSTVISHPTHAHNAYLELYSNTGIVGAIAFLFFLGIGLKLAWELVRSPHNHPWYGFGVGVVLACVATLLVGIVESAPIGVPLVASNTYYYLVSPVPWILAGLLVIAKKLQSAQPEAQHAGTSTQAP